MDRSVVHMEGWVTGQDIQVWDAIAGNALHRRSGLGTAFGMHVVDMTRALGKMFGRDA